ncbi:hypothetical protein [Clostridium coskatii]|uniref:hypothetical protein n=1 Tax=Clostridium coskatii TaxID=1705578 RepID=UPI0007BF8076|nr:hypothetical protein [Clostridium coskatii]QXE20441.1 hypothetical protein B5S50_17230 [Clostridium sp. 001]
MDMLYECLECASQEIVRVSNHRRMCKKCGGHLILIGYVGIDLASGRDKTTHPPVKKMEKS